MYISFVLFFLILLLIYSTCTSVIQHIPLESIDPSLAIGFYCRDKGTQIYGPDFSGYFMVVLFFVGLLLLELTTEPKKKIPFHS